MDSLSISLFHFCDNHGPTVLFTSKLTFGGPESISLLLKRSDLEKKRAYECSNCFSLAKETPYIISKGVHGTYAISGRSLFQTDEEASKINHIGKSLFYLSLTKFNEHLKNCNPETHLDIFFFTNRCTSFEL